MEGVIKLSKQVRIRCSSLPTASDSHVSVPSITSNKASLNAQTSSLETYPTMGIRSPLYLCLDTLLAVLHTKRS